jgi:(p)ppGpp synthase/HD superfamily hydrolase
MLVNRLEIGSLETERDTKLRSLYSDQIEPETRKLFESIEAAGLPRSDWEPIHRALEFARRQNYGPRDLDRFYITHPIRVARFMAQWMPRQAPLLRDAVTAGLVHNAIEKKILSAAQLETEYGAWVSRAIVTLTVDREDIKSHEGKLRYYGEIQKSDPETRAIKIFDKFDNLYTVPINPNGPVRNSYMDEIEEWMLPIVESTVPEILSHFREMLSSNREIGYRKYEMLPA